MERKEIILRLWDSAYNIEGWYPPLELSIKDLSHEQALWKPEGRAAHSIWQLLNHITFYKARFLARLLEKPFKEPVKTNEESFEWGLGASHKEWQARLDQMANIQRDVRKHVSQLNDRDLDKPCPEESIGAQLLSLVTHDGYHTGQIMYVRKLQGSWPEERDS